MDKLKQLEIKKLIKELDYIESDFEYKSEIIVENDGKFMIEVSKFLERNPQLKEMFDKKINDRIEDLIKNSQPNENTDIIKAEDEQSTIGDKDESGSDSGSGEIPSESGEETKEETESEESTQEDKSPKLKKLYREIVKLTHPDRVKVKKLNEIYIKATGMYDRNDLAGIYSVCNELKIDYEIDENDAENITTKITTLKDRIGFIESTITWKWHYSKTPQEKEQLVFLYIRMQLQQK